MRTICLGLAGLLLAACDAKAPTAPTGPESRKPAFATVELFADCPDSVTAVDIPAPVRDSIQAGITGNDMDEAWAIVARHVPGGFAGSWRASDGRITVGLVDISQRDAALAALQHEPLLPFPIPVDASVVPARWNFAQLVEWGRYLAPVIWREPEATMLDRDELANRLVTGVETPAGRDRLTAALHAYGAPCGLIRIEAFGRAIPAVAAPLDRAPPS